MTPLLGKPLSFVMEILFSLLLLLLSCFSRF